MLINREGSFVVHHLVLKFNRSNVRFNEKKFESNLYSMDLQTSLRQYKVEADKMIVYVYAILNMDEEPLIFDVGKVLFSKDNQSESFRTIHAIFSNLKAISSYQEYIFDNISVDKQDAIWDCLFADNTKLIKSYTIKYYLTAVKTREVTLYEFGESAVLLTVAEFTDKE